MSDDRQLDQEKPSHPKWKSFALIMAVFLLIVVLAAVSTFGT